jgi:hypothetical protein
MIEKIGKYRILERVGRGGMGTVFKAHDPILNRLVALKVISGEVEVSDELKARFFREARACAKLNHPNIILVYDLGEDQDRLFIVMEFLEGEELKRIIAERRPIPLETKLGLMSQICDGLHYAHQHGVIHRDIKPGNIFVLRNGQARILDFGIARIAANDPGLTRTGFIMGTLRYMSPEQARGRVDQRSDIFSVGAVFYELLAYRPAFDRENPMEILEQLRAEEPPSLTELDPSMPLAASPWARGDTAQRDAEDAAKRQDLEKAGTLFRDATKAFREAEVEATRKAMVAATTERERAAALRREREAADQAVAAAQAARREAEQAGASRLAAKALALAQEKEKEGRVAVERQDYAAARDRFREAQQDYQRARQEAVEVERRETTGEAQGKQEAEQGRTQVAQARGLADQADARRLTPKPWTDASARETEGQAAFGRGDYAAARERFREAQQDYQRAAQEAREAATQTTRQREAEQLRAGTAQARALAEQADAKRLAPKPWTDASGKEADAQGAFGRRDLAVAIKRFREARQEFQRAAAEAQQAAEAAKRQAAAPPPRSPEPTQPRPPVSTTTPPAESQTGGGVLGAVKRAFGGKLQGVSGPVAWEVVGVKTDTLPAEVRWSYTLVLRETTGTAIQFERVVHSVARGADLRAQVTEERFRRRLEANAELRLARPDGLTHSSAPGEDAVREGVTVWRRFYGKDEKGKDVVIDIQFRM